MAKLVSAYVLYDGKNNTYLGGSNKLVTLNCERLQAFSPRPVYLQRSVLGSDGTDIQYQPTFEISSADVAAYGTNLLQGLWIEQDDVMVVIDANLNDVTSQCNACCDDSPAVTLTRYYTGGVPAFSQPSLLTYCITRLDDGSPDAHQRIAWDYVGQSAGKFQLRSNISGVSHYTVTSYLPVVAQGSDTISVGACTS